MPHPVNSKAGGNAPATVGALLRGNELPRLEASVLLAHALGIRRESVLAYPERPVSATELDRYTECVQRRRDGVPVAYLTGLREFYGLELRVSPEVLIPRPESELIVDAVLQRLGPDASAAVLDLGTGSGAIAIAIARHRPHATVDAFDVSPGAVAAATANASALSLANVRVRRSDWYAECPDRARYDVIVSNPPYIKLGDPHLAEGDVRHEPMLALVGGADGLNAIRVVVAGASARLVDGGYLMFEHGYDQSAAALRLLRDAGFGAVESLRDLAGLERVAIGRRT